LAGIPESGRAVLRQYAKEQGLDGYLVTLKQPSVQAVLSYADNRGLRERHRLHRRDRQGRSPTGCARR
ncbi:MAG: hypothetical protein AAGL98_08325, partial [Planctomycetota bacterium]